MIGPEPSLVRLVIRMPTIAAAAGLYVAVQAQSPHVSPDLEAASQWRDIGPLNGGRMSAAAHRAKAGMSPSTCIT